MTKDIRENSWQCLFPFSASTPTDCYFNNALIFMCMPITQLLPLVITSPLHNNKQDVRNIGVGINFSWFKGILNLNYFNRMYMTLRQKLEEKSASYTHIRISRYFKTALFHMYVVAINDVQMNIFISYFEWKSTFKANTHLL